MKNHSESHSLPLGTKPNTFKFCTCQKNHYKNNAKISEEWGSFPHKQWNSDSLPSEFKEWIHSKALKILSSPSILYSETVTLIHVCITSGFYLPFTLLLVGVLHSKGSPKPRTQIQQPQIRKPSLYG